jgi:hypothetical protein
LRLTGPVCHGGPTDSASHCRGGPAAAACTAPSAAARGDWRGQRRAGRQVATSAGGGTGGASGGRVGWSPLPQVRGWAGPAEGSGAREMQDATPARPYGPPRIAASAVPAGIGCFQGGGPASEHRAATARAAAAPAYPPLPAAAPAAMAGRGRRGLGQACLHPSPQARQPAEPGGGGAAARCRSTFVATSFVSCASFQRYPSFIFWSRT